MSCHNVLIAGLNTKGKASLLAYLGVLGSREGDAYQDHCTCLLIREVNAFRHLSCAVVCKYEHQNLHVPTGMLAGWPGSTWVNDLLRAFHSKELLIFLETPKV